VSESRQYENNQELTLMAQRVHPGVDRVSWRYANHPSTPNKIAKTTNSSNGSVFTCIERERERERENVKLL